MKVIFLTQYFPPETGAPQNRLFAIARTLKEHGASVTVLTAMPNYPEMRIHRKYRGRFLFTERMSGMVVHRVWLLVSKKKGIIWRLANYFSFVFNALFAGLIKLRKSDILFVESPPLFLGITAMLLARAKGARMVFNVSDLWPESAVQLGLVTNKHMITASTWLEMKCYRSAALITGQTKGIVADIKARVPDKEVLWLPNGADLDAIGAVGDQGGELARLGIAPGTLVLTYAGIIGHAQGLDVILRAAEMLREKSVLFLLIGDGPVKPELEAGVTSRGLQERVKFIGRIERKQVLAIVKESDAVVVPLRKNDLFKGAIPSKIFEALALEKPLLLGVDGEARDLFIKDGDAGLFFEPENGASLAEAVTRYLENKDLLAQHGRNGSAYVRRNFDRRTISLSLLKALERIIQR